MSYTSQRLARFRWPVVVLFFVVPRVALGEVRVWKSSSGSHEIRAELISTDGESVTLRTEEGKEITVTLDKLSQADRDFAKAAEPVTTSTSDDTKRELQIAVTKFYRVVGKEGDELRALLTKEGQVSFDKSRAFFDQIIRPDRGQRVRVATVSVNEADQTAKVGYRIRMKGHSKTLQMLFRRQEDAWAIFGIVGPGPDGETNRMDFETAKTTTGSDDAPDVADTTLTTARSVATSGVSAYATGFCAKCHGEDGTGSERGPDLTDDVWDHCDGSVAGIRQVLVTGVNKQQLTDSKRPRMNPATNLVPAAQLDALAAYVKSLSAASNEGISTAK